MTAINYKEAQGWLRADESDYLVGLARYIDQHVVKPCFVNIGVEYGKSLVCLRVGAPQARIVGIDLDNSKAPQDLDVEYWEGDSGELANEWNENASIHLLFIDGDHTFYGVKRDTAWLKHVAPNGWVVFHDCYDFDNGYPHVHGVCPGVNEAVEEWYDKGMFIEDSPVGTCRIFRRVI